MDADVIRAYGTAKNSILEELPWAPLLEPHITHVRTALPAVKWRPIDTEPTKHNA